MLCSLSVDIEGDTVCIYFVGCRLQMPVNPTHNENQNVSETEEMAGSTCGSALFINMLLVTLEPKKIKNLRSSGLRDSCRSEMKR